MKRVDDERGKREEGPAPQTAGKGRTFRKGLGIRQVSSQLCYFELFRDFPICPLFFVAVSFSLFGIFFWIFFWIFLGIVLLSFLVSYLDTHKIPPMRNHFKKKYNGLG